MGHIRGFHRGEAEEWLEGVLDTVRPAAAARPSSSSTSIRPLLGRTPQTPTDDARIRSRSRSAGQRRPQKHVAPSVPPRAYRSPWLQIRTSSLENLLEQLSTVAQCPFSEASFLHAVPGNTEPPILNVKGRNITGLLYTIGGCLTSLLRDRFDQKPGAIRMQNKVFLCSKYILHKLSSRPTDVLEVLYDFVLNRCDEAAVRILTDQALVCDSPTFWTDLASLERDICLKAFHRFHQQILSEADNCKRKLLAMRTAAPPGQE